MAEATRDRISTGDGGTRSCPLVTTALVIFSWRVVTWLFQHALWVGGTLWVAGRCHMAADCSEVPRLFRLLSYLWPALALGPTKLLEPRLRPQNFARSMCCGVGRERCEVSGATVPLRPMNHESGKQQRVFHTPHHGLLPIKPTHTTVEAVLHHPHITTTQAQHAGLAVPRGCPGAGSTSRPCQGRERLRCVRLPVSVCRQQSGEARRGQGSGTPRTGPSGVLARVCFVAVAATAGAWVHLSNAAATTALLAINVFMGGAKVQGGGVLRSSLWWRLSAAAPHSMPEPVLEQSS